MVRERERREKITGERERDAIKICICRIVSSDCGSFTPGVSAPGPQLVRRGTVSCLPLSLRYGLHLVLAEPGEIYALYILSKQFTESFWTAIFTTLAQMKHASRLFRLTWGAQ